MPAVMQTSRSYPKRKRAQVKYYESSSEDSDEDGSYDAVEMESPSSKKLKASPKSQAISDKPLPKKRIFPFASLPAELKNQIYDITLTDPNGIHLISKTRHYRRTVERDVPEFTNSTSITNRRRKQRARIFGMPRLNASESQSQASLESEAAAKIAPMVPGILLLNKETYTQGRQILYGANKFFLEDTTALHQFLATIGPENRATLLDLTIKGWGYSKAHKAMNHPAFTLLASATNLQRLHMDCQIHWQGHPGLVATQFYRESFHFLQGLGTAKGKFDAAVEMVQVSQENFERRGYYQPESEPPGNYEEDLEEFRRCLRNLLISGRK